MVAVLTLSVFCSVICYTIVNYAAGKLSVVTLSIYGTLTTICSTFAGVVFLGEPLTPVAFLASLLIIFGVRQVTAAARPEQDASADKRNSPRPAPGRKY